MSAKTLALIFVVGSLGAAAEAFLILRLVRHDARAAALPGAAAPDAGPVLARIDELARRIADLDGAAARHDAAIASLERAPRRAALDAPAETPHAAAPAPAVDAADEAEVVLTALLPRVLGAGRDTASLEEQERFWRLARESAWLGEHLAALEERVARDPADLEARFELGQAYVAKLLTVPAGPERGVWGMRAEEQWQAVVAVDPRHWDATFSLGESWSYYPAFLGKGKAALETLERARAIQEAGAQEPHQAETYTLLARLYGQAGDEEAARAALTAGVAAHPHDAELADALAALDE